MNHIYAHCRTVALVLVSLFLSSCLDIETTTTVHRDGKITKVMTFTGDSGIVTQREFPLRLDDTWKLTEGRTTENKFCVTAERTFASTEELDAALKGEAMKHVTIETKLESTFQWFFTSYRYSEIWKSYKQIDEVPLSRYVDPKLLDLFYRHQVQKEPFATPEDSLVLERGEKSFEEYKARNVFEACYKEFLKGVKILNNPALPSSLVEQKKEELFQSASKEFKDNHLDTLKFIFAKTLKSSLVLVTRAIEANTEGFALVKKRIDFEFQIGSYGYKVSAVMPGIITATNSRSIDGSTARWEDFIFMGLLTDFDLWVESRALNWWAVVITAVIVVGIVIYLFAAFYRRKRY